MPRPTIHYVAGLPRSGSTLLVNMLAQHPNHHVTPTNGLLSMVLGVRDNWSSNSAFRAQGLDAVQPRITEAMRAMIYGFYAPELAAGKVVFDKSRGWLPHAELLAALFDRPVPIICPVRDVKSIVASFERLHRASPVDRRHFMGPSYLKAQTILGRAQVLCSDGGVIGLPVAWLRDALARGIADRVVLVPYRQLTEHPSDTLFHLHRRLALPTPPTGYDPSNVEQVTHEDDAVHGWGSELHRIRARVEPPPEKPWEGVLPPHVCRWIDSNFGDVNRLAALPLSTQEDPAPRPPGPAS
jgi:sulfotransferase